jgi:hypothetical protein
MEDPKLIEFLDCAYKREIHNIYLTGPVNVVRNNSAPFANSYLHTIKLENSVGVNDQDTYSEVVKVAAHVTIFNLIVDYELNSLEYQRFEKLVFH